MAIVGGAPLTGASNAGGVWKNRNFRPIFIRQNGSNNIIKSKNKTHAEVKQDGYTETHIRSIE